MTGGLKLASNWQEAYSNAKSMIVVIVQTNITGSTTNIDFTFTIPKNFIRSTVAYFTTGACHSTSNYWYVEYVCSATIGYTTAYHNGSNSNITTTVSLFYD